MAHAAPHPLRNGKGSTVYSDKLLSYTGLENDFDHQVIDNAVSCVEGRISTNQLENFWALMKRTLHGTYVSVDPEHLGRYVGEQVWRFNARRRRGALRDGSESNGR